MIQIIQSNLAWRSQMYPITYPAINNIRLLNHRDEQVSPQPTVHLSFENQGG